MPKLLGELKHFLKLNSSTLSQNDIEQVLFSEDEAGRIRFIGLIKPARAKEDNFPNFIPCEIYTAPLGDGGKSETIVCYKPMLLSTSKNLVEVGRDSKYFAKMIEECFIVLSKEVTTD